MPDTGQLSHGALLLEHHGIRQGCGFTAAILDEGTQREWAAYRSDPALRSKSLKSDDKLLVVSQDCDIACRNDAHDPCIELAVFSPIKPKQRHAGNQFAHATRKLQMPIEGAEHEAKVRYTVRVPKACVHAALKQNADQVFKLPEEQRLTLALWRANRYQRAALPDRFNAAFMPLFEQALPDLESLARIPGDNHPVSYIRAVYVHLDNTEEEGPCAFSLLAMLRKGTPDDVQSRLDDKMEELCQALADATGFELSEHADLAGLAERETTVPVFVLGLYVKLNLDYLSLREGDPDTGV